MWDGDVATGTFARLADATARAYTLKAMHPDRAYVVRSQARRPLLALTRVAPSTRRLSIDSLLEVIAAS